MEHHLSIHIIIPYTVRSYYDNIVIIPYTVRSYYDNIVIIPHTVRSYYDNIVYYAIIIQITCNNNCTV